jgi:hypothetical protein
VIQSFRKLKQEPGPELLGKGYRLESGVASENVGYGMSSKDRSFRDFLRLSSCQKKAIYVGGRAALTH